MPCNPKNRLSVYIPDGLKNELSSLCREKDESASAVVRRALAVEFATQGHRTTHTRVAKRQGELK